jgi:uncharacterized membrane protein YgcG
MSRLAKPFRPLNLIITILLLLVATGGFLWRSHQIDARKPAAARPEGPSTHIFDYGRLLMDAEPDLNRAMAHVKDTYGIETIVVTVATVPDELTLPELARRLSDNWQVGATLDGRGVLILAASDARQVHLEIGPGLSDRFTDAFRRRIQAWPWQTYFNDGSVADGIKHALEQIETSARQAEDP